MPAFVNPTLLPADTDLDELVLRRWDGERWTYMPQTLTRLDNGNLIFEATNREPGIYAVTIEPDRSTYRPAPVPGKTATLWRGGTPERAVEGIESLWIVVDGRFIGYAPGASDFVNAAFLVRFPTSEIPYGSVVLTVRSRTR